MTHISVWVVTYTAVRLGKGSLIAKIDVKSAYRLVPVVQHEKHWLSMKWKDHVYIDHMLPFGLRSAPKVLTHSPVIVPYGALI